MPEALYAAVDQGSTSTKAALITAGGEIVYRTSRAIERAADGDSVWHDPDEIAASVISVLDRIFRRARPRAIGLACQRSTCLLWDRAGGQAMTEARSWQDRSRARAAERLSSRAAWVKRRTGLPLSPHYAALKLAELWRRERARPAQTLAGTLDAFLVQRLTGSASTEPGQAGRTLCLNLETNTWDPKLCALFGIPPEALPAIRPSAGRRGSYRGVPLTALAGDQQAALLGHGGWRPGVTAVHFGTGAFALASVGPRPRFDRRVLSAAIATTRRARRYQVEASINAAGAAVDWIFDLTGRRIQDWRDRSLGEPGPAASPHPILLPAFAGLATPYWRPEARAVFAGIDSGTGADELIAATLRALAMRVADCVETLESAGASVGSLRVSGKLTRLRGLIQAIASACQVPVAVSELEETGLVGIARLAQAGFEGRSRALDQGGAVQARVPPAWSGAEARRVRRHWRRFVQKALTVST